MIRKPTIILEKNMVTLGIPHRLIIERVVPMRTSGNNRQDFNNYLRLMQDQGLTMNDGQLDIDTPIWQAIGRKYKLYQARWVDTRGNDFVFCYFSTGVTLNGGLDVDGSILYSMRYWFDYSRGHKNKFMIRMSQMTNHRNEQLLSMVTLLEDLMENIAGDVDTYKRMNHAEFSVSKGDAYVRVKTDRALVGDDIAMMIPAPVPEYNVH